MTFQRSLKIIGNVILRKIAWTSFLSKTAKVG